MHTYAFIAVYSGEQVWPLGLLFIKTSPVKQYSYEKDFSGVFDAVHQSFLVMICIYELDLHIMYFTHMSHIMRKPVYAICEQQRCRLASASAQSDQRLWCPLPR